MVWNLYDDEKFLAPLKFSNGKTQEDTVKEILEAIKEGNKISNNKLYNLIVNTIKNRIKNNKLEFKDEYKKFTFCTDGPCKWDKSTNQLFGPPLHR